MTLHAAGDRFLLARRYASAGIAMASCLCPSVSVISRCSIETDGRIELVFFASRLLSTSPTLWYKEIQLSTEIRVIPLELLAILRT